MTSAPVSDRVIVFSGSTAAEYDAGSTRWETFDAPMHRLDATQSVAISN
jgi:hypothetical protein